MDDKIRDFLLETVSSGDAAPFSVSGGDAAYYEINIYTVSGNDGEAALQEEQYTLFDKPLEKYTVSEGLLLILVLLLVGKYVFSAIKEGFKWMSW